MPKKIEIAKPAAWIFVFATLSLGAVNLFLFSSNRELASALVQHARSLEPKVGARAGGIMGFDISGKIAPILFGADKRKTLLLVFSPSCGVCDRNWPEWQSLLGRIQQSNVRVIAVNLYYQLPAEYIAKHELSAIQTIAQVDPQSVVNWNFGLTPQTILVEPNGTIARVWTGLLDQSRLQEITSSIESR